MLPSVVTQPARPIAVPNPGPMSQGGLILSPASEVIPQKLVERIRSGRYVEMKELLADNMALLSQLESFEGPAFIHSVGANRPRLREVTSLLSWCHCFLGYVATMTSDPTTRDQLAYARLLMREAQRHGGSAWLDYDRAFRQQLAVEPSNRWNIMNPSLLASTMLGQPPTPQSSFCTLCRMVYHNRSQCALAYLERPTPIVPPPRPTQPGRKPRFVQPGPV